MQVSETVSVKINNMRIIAAALVVSIHLGVLFKLWSPGWWVSEMTRSGISTVAVPFFFIVSGFFLMGKDCPNWREWWRREVVKRVRTLLVPLLFWLVLGVMWSTPFIMVANKMSGRELTHSLLFFNGEWLPGLGHLWYLRFLFVMTILFPILSRLIRYLGLKWVVFAFMVCWSVYSCPWIDHDTKMYLDWKGINLSGIAYLSLGAFLRLKYDASSDMHMRDKCGKILNFNKYILGMLGVLMFGVAVWLHGRNESVQLTHLAIPFTLLSIWLFVPAYKFPEWLTSAAFPVYLLHTMVVLPVNIVFKRMGFIDGAMSYLCRWIVVFVVSVLLAILLRRLMPRTAKIVFGGR